MRVAATSLRAGLTTARYGGGRVVRTYRGMRQCLAVCLLLAVTGHAIRGDDLPAAAADDAGAATTVVDSLPQELRMLVDVESAEMDDIARLAACRILEFSAGIETAELWQQATATITARRQEFRSAPEDAGQAFNLYFDMVTFPQRYAARPVAVSGNVRRILSYRAPEGCDTETLYESWIYTAESGSNPVIVLTTSLPEGLAPGEDQFEAVQVAGWFFKLLAHLPEEPERRAPMLLAGELSLATQEAGGLTAVDPAWWNVVRDRTAGILDAESDLYYRVLKIGADQPVAELRRAAEEHVAARREVVPRYQQHPQLAFNTFVDLFEYPQANHGQPLVLSGHVRSWKSYPAGSNSYGLKTLYELWLFPEDGQQNPVVVITTSIPEGLPRLTGESDLIDHVKVEGWFFKLYGYRAQQKMLLAPMVLAARVSWQPIADPAPPEWLAPAIGLGTMVVLGVIVCFVWRSTRRDRAAGRKVHFAEGDAAAFSMEPTADEVFDPTPPDASSEESR